MMKKYSVGDIVHVSGLPINPKKGKYCVLVCLAPNRFFLVNTENRLIYDCIPLNKKGRPFPVYDSFIGCKNIFEAEDKQINSVCGKLDDDELRYLLQKITESKFIPQVQKSPLISAIQSELSLREKQDS
jgi:hypothetical protein